MISKAFIDGFVSRDPEPSNVESLQFFFLEKGVGLEECNGLPIPYIIGMVWVASENHKRQEKDMKKKGKKGF